MTKTIIKVSCYVALFCSLYFLFSGVYTYFTAELKTILQETLILVALNGVALMGAVLYFINNIPEPEKQEVGTNKH